VRQLLPAGWRCAGGCRYEATLTSGAALTGADLGSFQPVAIAGTVYEDEDADGQRDAGEAGLEDWPVKIDPGTGSDGSDDRSAVTAADGSFAFDDLLPGVSYRVYEVLPAGWRCTGPSGDCEYEVAAVSGDGTLGGRDFGNRQDGNVVVRNRATEAGGTAFPFRAGASLGGTTFELGDGESRAFAVPPGTHVVEAGEVEGFELRSVECDDTDSTGSVESRRASYTVAPGETVTCTFGSALRAGEEPPDEEPPTLTVGPPAGAAPGPGGDAAGGATPSTCLQRRIYAYVSGGAVRRVTFLLDGEVLAQVRRPDGRGRFGVGFSRRRLAPGAHRLAAIVVLRSGRTVRLRTTIRRCLSPTAPARIAGTPMACAARPFVASVRSETIRRVRWEIDGHLVGTRTAADWRARYTVRVDPRRLSAGTHRLTAKISFIRGAGMPPRTLDADLRRCR
jgi:hypothetical protein